MPWLVDPRTFTSAEVSWGRLYSDDGKARVPEGWAHPDVIPAENTWPLEFKQSSKHKKLHDLMRGALNPAIFVSRKFRALVEEMDPVTHHFIPLHLHLADGFLSIGEYFLFKFGEFTDAIVEQKSQLSGQYSDEGELRWYARTKVSPKVTWCRQRLGHRHFWSDKYLLNDLFCSDEFMEQLERRKMRLFEKFPSFYDKNGGQEAC